jgi:hypothetical protein
VKPERALTGNKAENVVDVRGIESLKILEMT